MTEQNDKQRLERARALARELAKMAKDKQLAEDLRFINEHGLQLNPGHLQRLRATAQTNHLSYKTASLHLREQIQHDNLDFTLPDLSVSRMKTIIRLIDEISRVSIWRAKFEMYLLDGNEEKLLNVLEDISWAAFEERIPLSTYCQSLSTFPVKYLESVQS